jgi:Phosphotransferase enzyme family
VDLSDVEGWIRMHADPVGPIETAHERPWATVLRVPLPDGVAWFKACAPAQAFEPRLTADLFSRWPDRVPGVLTCDEQRVWLLLADAGTPVGAFGNPPQAWLTALPRYAELQRGEAVHAQEHLANGVPDLRLATLPARYEELLQLNLPLQRAEIRRWRDFGSRFAELCADLAAHEVPETVQHDDLHHSNLFVQGNSVRVLDWGDASIAHPFASLVVTFRFLEERSGLASGDRWFARLRNADLAPWNADLRDAFALALRVGTFARPIAYIRQRAAIAPDVRSRFDEDFSIALRRAVAQTGD